MEDLKIRLVLDGVAEVQAGANRAADGVKKLGEGAQKAGQQAQLSGHQMAQVSAQLQDLFIQIQGGQAPITALLQQGSQLTTVFGGVSGALGAVSGFAASLVNPFTLAAGAVAALGYAYIKGQAESQAYARALTLSGNAAGVTVGQLQAMAQAQSQVVGTQSDAAAALTALASSGQVSAISLGTAAEAATRLARVGIPLEDTAKKFVALGKEPVKALIELNQAENFLTVSVYKHIKALEDRGRIAEAGAAAQAEYARISIQRGKELDDQLGFLEKAWRGVGDGAKWAWDRMLNIGRPLTAQDQLKAIEQQLKTLETKSRAVGRDNAMASAMFGVSANSDFGDSARAALEQKAESLREVIRLQGRYAMTQAESASAVKSAIKADEDAAEAAKKLAAERDRDAAALERAIGLSGSYQKDLSELLRLRERGALTEEQYVVAVGKLITAQPMVRDQLEKQAAAHKAAARALEDQLKAEQQRIDAIYKGADQVADHVRKLQEEEKAIALAASSNITLAEAIERVTIARIEELHAKATAQNDYGAAAALRAEIEAREKLAGLIGRKEARETTKRGAEDAAREWKRTTDEIERSLTDALLRGFESGKGFAVNLRDTLVNMFKTLVLRPIIQPIASSAAGTLSSWLGGGSSAGFVGLNSVGSLLSSLGNLFGSGRLSAVGAGMGLSGAQAGAAAGAYNAAGMGGMGSSLKLGSSIAAFVPWAALIMAGMTMADKAFSQGFNEDNLPYTRAWLATGGIAPPTLKFDTNLLQKLGVSAGAANVITGASLWSKAFGRSDPQVQGTGITGTASSGGFTGQAFADWLQKGGWFRSDKRGTDFSAVTTEQDALLDAGIQALYKATGEYAKVLGLPLDSLNSYAATFKVVWGKTDEENQAAIQAAMANLGEQLAARYATQLAPLQKAGETLATTLSRLSTLQTFSNSLNNLGGVFSALAGSSVAARERVIELVGGMDALAQQALSFAQNYYNRDEIAGMKAKDVQAALSAAGITADLGSRDQFRALVESLDPSTETGAKQLAALLSLQGSFATVADYLSETGLTLSQAAQQAPSSDLLTPLLSTTSQQLQLSQQSMDAQIETRDATLQVVGAVQALTAAVLASGGVSGPTVPGYREPEVTLAY